jgi:hypothetical protein
MSRFDYLAGHWLPAIVCSIVAMTAVAGPASAASPTSHSHHSPFGIQLIGCDDGCTDLRRLENGERMADDSALGDLQLGETFAAFTGSSFPVAALATDGGGYIDYAVVGNFFRFRFDAAYDNPTPDRAEFLYRQADLAQGIGDWGVDFQDFSPYLELAWNERLSFFVETPIRLINGEMTGATGGFSDMNAGFKYALIASPDEYLTLQLRVYAPTGDADRFLGNGHATIEPGILYYRRWSERISLYGELRDWIPVGGTKTDDGRHFAGNILRYGVGAGYDLLNPYYACNNQRLMAVGEMVGWTVLGGQVTNFEDFEVESASGDTIVNAKVGMRYCVNQHSFYAGYGRALTGDIWYQDVLRFEYRMGF